MTGTREHVKERKPLSAALELGATMEILGTIVVLAALLAGAVSIVAVVWPSKRLGLGTRKRAAAALGSSLLLLVAGAFLVPADPERDARRAEAAQLRQAEAVARREADRRRVMETQELRTGARAAEPRSLAQTDSARGEKASAEAAAVQADLERRRVAVLTTCVNPTADRVYVQDTHAHLQCALPRWREGGSVADAVREVRRTVEVMQAGPIPISPTVETVTFFFQVPDRNRFGEDTFDKLFVADFAAADLRRARLDRLSDAQLIGLATKAHTSSPRSERAVTSWCGTHPDAYSFCSQAAG